MGFKSAKEFDTPLFKELWRLCAPLAPDRFEAIVVELVKMDRLPRPYDVDQAIKKRAEPKFYVAPPRTAGEARPLEQIVSSPSRYHYCPAEGQMVRNKGDRCERCGADHGAPPLGWRNEEAE